MERKELRVVFMGTPEFAKCSLSHLVEAGFQVVGVFTKPDTPSGRGMKVKMSPVKDYAIKQGIAVFQPEKIKNNPAVMAILEELMPDVIAVTAYGKILPKELLDFPKFGAINVHGSLLPKYRGAAPIHHAMMNGEKETGITTMYMDVGMDTGDMLLKESTPILDTDNLETMTNKLMEIGGRLLVQTLDKLMEGSLKRIKQGENFTLAPMIEKENTKIDFASDAHAISCFVRGLCPTIGTFINTQEGNKYKVYLVEAVKDSLISDTYPVGSIVKVDKSNLWIACKDGYIKILEIQPPGSKKMDIISFLQGNKIELTQKFR